MDLSTISYMPTLEIDRRLKAKGVKFADAPVSGMEARAKEGKITVMFGGDKALFKTVRPALDAIGNQIVYMGAVGCGQLTKLINQLLFNISCAGLAEVLPMAAKLGLDPEQVAQVVTTGTGRSFAAEFFIPLTLQNKFDEGYPVKAAYKDMISAAEISAHKAHPASRGERHGGDLPDGHRGGVRRSQQGRTDPGLREDDRDRIPEEGGKEMNPHRGRPEDITEAYYRGLMHSVGYRRSDLDKPQIAVVNSWTDINPGHQPLRELAQRVKEGIWAAGGCPSEFGVPAPCDGMAQGPGMHYILPQRDLIAGSIEAMVGAHGFEGLVFLGSCDKILPGMLMAAIRMNLPTLFLTAGAMMPCRIDGKVMTTPDLKEAIGGRSSGKIDEETFLVWQERFCAHRRDLLDDGDGQHDGVLPGGDGARALRLGDDARLRRRQGPPGARGGRADRAISPDGTSPSAIS